MFAVAGAAIFAAAFAAVGVLAFTQTLPNLVAFAQLRRQWRTPVRLMRFLEDARARGILRTIGPVYQFRHAALQDHLARQALTMQPQTAAGHDTRATLLWSLGRSREALAAYDKAIDLDPGNASAQCHRATLLLAADHLDEALISYDLIISKFPRFPNPHNLRGVILLAQGHLRSALAVFDQALALDPDHVNANINRSIALQAINGVHITDGPRQESRL